MNMMNRLASSVLAFGVLVFSNIALAELPPYVYDEMKEKSPEVLTIHVKQMEEVGEENDNQILYRAWAEVLEVMKSKSRVKVGDLIRIEYHIAIHEDGWVGPSDPEILSVSKSYRVYLMRKGSKYSPAAGGASFRHKGYK